MQKRESKYGLENIPVGGTRTYNEPRCRINSSAQMIGRRHGIYFQVSGADYDVTVTRLANRKPRNQQKGRYLNMGVGDSAGFDTHSQATSGWNAAKKQVPHATWSVRKTREAFLVIRIA